MTALTRPLTPTQRRERKQLEDAARRAAGANRLANAVLKQLNRQGRR